MPIIGGASGSSNLVLLSDQTLGAGGAATVDFTSLAYYPAYLIIYEIEIGGATDIVIRFNNDSGNVYYNEVIRAVGAVITSASSTNTSGLIGRDGGYGGGSILIKNPAATVRKSWTSEYGRDDYRMCGGGYWGNIADLISRITVISSGTFGQGTRMILYGFKV